MPTMQQEIIDGTSNVDVGLNTNNFNRTELQQLIWQK